MFGTIKSPLRSNLMEACELRILKVRQRTMVFDSNLCKKCSQNLQYISVRYQNISMSFGCLFTLMNNLQCSLQRILCAFHVMAGQHTRIIFVCVPNDGIIIVASQVKVTKISVTTQFLLGGNRQQIIHQFLPLS